MTDDGSVGPGCPAHAQMSDPAVSAVHRGAHSHQGSDVVKVRTCYPCPGTGELSRPHWGT